MVKDLLQTILDVTRLNQSIEFSFSKPEGLRLTVSQLNHDIDNNEFVQESTISDAYLDSLDSSRRDEVVAQRIQGNSQVLKDRLHNTEKM